MGRNPYAFNITQSSLSLQGKPPWEWLSLGKRTPIDSPVPNGSPDNLYISSIRPIEQVVFKDIWHLVEKETKYEKEYEKVHRRLLLKSGKGEVM